MDHTVTTEWIEEPVVCKICGPSQERVLGFRGGNAHRRGEGIRSRIVQCRRCGLVYANPSPRPVTPFAHYHDADQYFRHHVPDVKIRRYLERLDTAERLLGRKGRMLDVGCGRGESLVAAARGGWQAVGVEPSADFAATAREQYGVDVRPSELAEAGFPDAAFDCVTIGAVLEHVYDPMALLREVRRVLVPGGVVYIGVPNEAGFYWTIGNLYQRLRGRDWVLNISPTFEPFHTFGWSRRSIGAALRRAGFRIENARTYADKAFFRMMRPQATLYERAAEVIDRAGELVGQGSQLVVWARAA